MLLSYYSNKYAYLFLQLNVRYWLKTKCKLIKKKQYPKINSGVSISLIFTLYSRVFLWGIGLLILVLQVIII